MNAVVSAVLDTRREAIAHAERSALIVMNDPREAAAIAEALRLSGWHPCDIVDRPAAAIERLRSADAVPDLMITGLRFDEGDGFQLIRSLAQCPRPPAVFIASHQQRAVIRSAITLAAACGVSIAGMAEQPVQPDAIAEALRHHQPTRAAPVLPTPHVVPAELSREELLSMLERDAIVPWLQPKVRIDSGEVVGFEALMRARDEAGRLVMPDRLVPALARHGLLDRATLVMADHTVDFVAACLSEGMAISASINVAMQSLADLAFCQKLVDAVERVELDPSWITIEITETDAMSDLAQVIENTGRIRMLGFKLAIDDFGTAYSSLFQLSRIPFSELKIERAFVSGLQNDLGHQAIVRACAQLGDSFGLHVVAEGVETAEELACVARCGCSQIQGYHVSRPVPAAVALDWLRSLDGLRALP